MKNLKRPIYTHGAHCLPTEGIVSDEIAAYLIETERCTAEDFEEVESKETKEIKTKK